MHLAGLGSWFLVLLWLLEIFAPPQQQREACCNVPQHAAAFPVHLVGYPPTAPSAGCQAPSVDPPPAIVGRPFLSSRPLTRTPRVVLFHPLFVALRNVMVQTRYLPTLLCAPHAYSRQELWSMAGVEVNAACSAVVATGKKQARQPANCNCRKPFGCSGRQAPRGACSSTCSR